MSEYRVYELTGHDEAEMDREFRDIVKDKPDVNKACTRLGNIANSVPDARTDLERLELPCRMVVKDTL
jgi:hypothetical protein